MSSSYGRPRTWVGTFPAISSGSNAGRSVRTADSVGGAPTMLGEVCWGRWETADMRVPRTRGRARVGRLTRRAHATPVRARKRAGHAVEKGEWAKMVFGRPRKAFALFYFILFPIPFFLFPNSIWIKNFEFKLGPNSFSNHIVKLKYKFWKYSYIIYIFISFLFFSSSKLLFLV
jgi:hypothetical protein